MVSASSGQPGGFRRSSASSPARSSTARTAATWTGSPLCEAHDHRHLRDRGGARRSRSARRRPARASCTSARRSIAIGVARRRDQAFRRRRRPRRARGGSTPRARSGPPGRAGRRIHGRSAQGERGVLLVPALELVLQGVQHADHVAAGIGDLALLGGEQRRPRSRGASSSSAVGSRDARRPRPAARPAGARAAVSSSGSATLSASPREACRLVAGQDLAPAGPPAGRSPRRVPRASSSARRISARPCTRRRSSERYSRSAMHSSRRAAESSSVSASIPSTYAGSRIRSMRRLAGASARSRRRCYAPGRAQQTASSA